MVREHDARCFQSVGRSAGRLLQQPVRREMVQKMRELAAGLAGLAALLEADQAVDVPRPQAGDDIGRRIIEDIVNGEG